MKTNVLLVTAASICIAGSMFTQSARADLTLDGSSTAGFGTDRYAPNSFVSTTAPDGSTALATTISSADDQVNRPSGYNSAFYNTQGHGIAVNGTTGNWGIGEGLYVTAAMLAGTAGSMSSEFSAVTGGGSGYYWMSFLSGVTARDAANAAPSSGSQIGIFNNVTGLWSYFSTAGMKAGWNQINVDYNGSSVNYSVNGNTISSQGLSITSQDPSVNNLTSILIEDYNYFGQANQPATGDYTTYRDNITANTGDNYGAVPEPSTYIAGMLLLIPFSFSSVRALRKQKMARA